MFTRVLLGGVLLGVLPAGIYMCSQAQSETHVPMHKRQAADQQACVVAEQAIAAQLAPTQASFTSACRPPVVTRLWTRPGFVAVTRSVKELDATSTASRRTFSVLLDGRHTDGWQIVDVRQAPNKLTVDISMLPLGGPEASQEAKAR
jgi:hypothetical protein